MSFFAAAPLLLSLLAASPSAASLDGLKLNQLLMEGSHNSYRKLPSPAEEQRIKTIYPQAWSSLDYGHPPLESQLALGLRQFEIDVNPDPLGGAHTGPYADATPQVKAIMAAFGAKVVHIAGLDTEVHCLTFRACLGVFARWSDAHPGHAPLVILVNSSDAKRIAGAFETPVAFDQASIDALQDDIAAVIGRARVITPDDVRGARATLREAVLAKAWPTVAAARGKFLFVLDGSPAHEAFLKDGHPSLRGRMMFGWFDEAEAEAAFFNIQDPLKEPDRIRRLVSAGFMVRTRSDADTKEARNRDGRRMKAALASGAQFVSTDYYEGAPDPEAFGYVADFEGPMVRCNPVTSACKR